MGDNAGSKKAELSFLYKPNPLVLLTFLQNTIKIFRRVFELQSRHGMDFKSKTKGGNSKSKKARDAVLVREPSYRSGPHFNQVS